MPLRGMACAAAPLPRTRSHAHTRLASARPPPAPQWTAAGGTAAPVANPAKRFAATLGELTGGRVGLTAASVGVLKGALTIAVRYSAQRQQFGPPDAPEVSVLDYPSQQVGGVGDCFKGMSAGRLLQGDSGSAPSHPCPPSPPTEPHARAPSLQAKLMPMLATCYALVFAKNKARGRVGAGGGCMRWGRPLFHHTACLPSLPLTCPSPSLPLRYRSWSISTAR